MSDLSQFRERVREICRRARPYDDGRRASLADLAGAIALSRSELSARLNATGARLTDRDARAIVRTFAEWGAISTRAEAAELLALVDCPPFTPAEWQAPPLDRLEGDAHIPKVDAEKGEASGHREKSEEATPTISNQHPAISIAVHTPEGGSRIVGRLAELAQLAEAVAQHSCVAIVGVGGIGKSTLAAAYAAGAGYTRCWRNLHHNPSFADTVAAALALLGQSFQPGEMPRPADQANHIAAVLRETATPLLLVLNNFESVMRPDETEDGWRELLELVVVGGVGASRLLLTSRERPRSRQGQEAFRFALGGLQPADSLALLNQLGVDAEREQLQQAAQQAGGHPLALRFLADLLHHEGYSLAELLAAPVWNERIAELLLDIIYRKLPALQQRALSYFSLFDQPTTPTTVAAMLGQLAPPIIVAEAEVRGWAEQLAARSLLEGWRGAYQAHPIVRTYAYQLLPDVATYHRAAAAYFRRRYTRDPHIAPPRNVAEVQPLLDAFDHLCSAGEYAAAYVILREMPLEYMRGGDWLGLNPLLARWGEFGRLREMNERIAFAPPDALGQQERGRMLGNLGIVYANIGEFTRAVDCYWQAIALAQLVGDEQGKGRVLGNLGNAYRKLGDYPQAIACYEQALAIAEQTADRQTVGAHLGNLATAYTALGDYAAAIDRYAEAISLAEAAGDLQTLSTHLGSLGLVYDALGQHESAIEQHRRALTVATTVGDRREQGRHWNNLGEAYAALGQPAAALDSFRKSVATLEPLGANYTAAPLHNIEQLQAGMSAEDWWAVELEALNIVIT